MPSPGLYPMQPVGENSSSRKLLTYGERDIIGVENPAASISDYTGINEGFGWTRRVKATVGPEHDMNGVHFTPKIPRAVVKMGFNRDAVTYAFDPYLCYVQDATLGAFVGSSAFTYAYVGPGHLQITLKAGYHFPSTTLAVANFVEDHQPTKDSKDYSNCVKTRIYLKTVTNDHVFEINRYEGTDPSSLVLTDGSICFAVYC